MVNKKSKKIVLVILAVLILFCCTILLKAIYKVQSAKKADISKNVLTWVIPESISLDQKKIKKFNETLYQDGYDFCVKFETLEEDDFDRSVYKNELEKVLKEKKGCLRCWHIHRKQPYRLQSEEFHWRLDLRVAMWF